MPRLSEKRREVRRREDTALLLLQNQIREFELKITKSIEDFKTEVREDIGKTNAIIEPIAKLYDQSSFMAKSIMKILGGITLILGVIYGIKNLGWASILDHLR